MLKPVAYCVMLAFCDIAVANPNGPQVAAGSAAFASSGKALTVTNAPGTIINWNAFSIGSGELTRFVQQSAASAVLNRVVGRDVSNIFGTLSSNGRVFLINPNGIIFGAGSVINTAGFVASTLNMTDQDFLTGKLRFSGGGNGALQNAGTIRASSDIVLVGPTIQNSGIIRSDNGSVLLAAGKALTITSPDAHGVTFTMQAPSDSAVNLGTIQAANAGSMFAGTLRHSGDIDVTSVSRDSAGRIVLSAQTDAIVDGRIRANSVAGAGGNVAILGDRVSLLDGANVTASGPTGGGTILVGGDYQGRNPDVQNATTTVLAAGATVRADALTKGDGGKIILWSTDTTRLHGLISARGAGGGKGGFVETSSHGLLSVTRLPDIGAGGTWLLDPKNLFVESTATTATANNSLGTTTYVPNPDDSVVMNTDINAQLNAGTNVILDTGAPGLQQGNITVNAAITKTNSNSASLTLTANNSITVNQPIDLSVGSGNVDMNTTTTSGVVTLTQSVRAGGSSTFNLNGGLLIRGNGSLFTTTGQDITARGITLTGDTGTVALQNSTSGNQNVTAGIGGMMITATAGISSINQQSATGGQTITVNGGGLSLSGGDASGGASIVTAGPSQTVTVNGAGSIIALYGGTVPGATASISANNGTQDISTTAGNIVLQGGSSVGTSGSNSSALIFASGAQTINSGTAGIALNSGNTGANNATQIISSTSQSITAGTDIQLTGSTSSGILNSADIRQNGASGTQSVTAGGSIILQAGNAVGAGANCGVAGSCATIVNVGSGQQTIQAAGITMNGGGGGDNNGAFLNNNNTASTQQVTITGAGSIAITGGSGTGINNQAALQSDGNQTINFNAGGTIAITGGTNGQLNFARIQTRTTTNSSQTITGVDGITVTGGASGGGYVTSPGYGTRGNFAQIIASGDQSITVGGAGITIEGGGGSQSDNFATIYQVGSGALRQQSITINGGGNLTLTGGSSSGVAVSTQSSGSFAWLRADGGAGQTINFGSATSAINITGGTNGTGNSATVNARFGQQTISGSPAVTIIGGASGGVQGDANDATIQADAGTQTLTLGAVQITGGPGGNSNSAGFRAPTEIITVNGNLTLSGSTGGSNFTGARIGPVSGAAGDVNLTVHGNITMNPGDVANSGATIGPSSNVTAAFNAPITINADGDVTLNAGNTGASRIGQPSNFVGSGAISVSAGGNIVLAGTTGAGSQIRTLSNVTLNATTANKSITQGANSQIAANTLTANSHSGITLNGNNSVAIFNASNSTANGIQFTETAGALLTVTGMSQTGGNVQVTADDLNITGAINAGANTVTLRPTTLSRDVNLTTGAPANALNLTPAELNFVTASQLDIGRIDGTGALSVTASLASSDINATTLRLFSGSDMSITASFGTGGSEFDNNLVANAKNNLSVSDASLVFTNARSVALVADSDGSGAGNLTIANSSGTARAISAGTTAGNTEDMILRGRNVTIGGGNGGMTVSLRGTGTQTITAPGTLLLQGTSAVSGAAEARASEGIQTITAGGITLNAASGGSSNGAQLVALTQGITAGTGGIALTAGGGPNNGAAIQQIGGAAIQNITVNGGNVTLTGGSATNTFASISASGPTQTIVINNGDRLQLTPVTGNATISAAGNQNITLQGAGQNSIVLGSPTAGASSQVTAAAQTIVAGQTAQTGSITLIGGTTNNTAASIFTGTGSGAQSVTTTGTLSITGGTASGVNGADAGIRQNANGLQSVAANAIVLQGGSAGAGDNNAFISVVGTGAQQITAGAGGVSLTGGSGGSTNTADISNNATGSGQTITINNGGSLVLQGGSSSGTGNEARIRAGTSQTINFAAGGNLQLSGGTNGAGNRAEIRANSGAQTITGAPSFTMTGGSSGGVTNNGNSANLISVSSQNLTLGTTQLSAGSAGVDNFASFQSPSQTITVNGNLTLTGGGATGSSSARIGSPPSDPMSLGLTVHGDLALNGGPASAALVAISGNSTVQQNANITANVDGNITLTGGAGGVVRVGQPPTLSGGATNAGAGNIALTAGGNISIPASTAGTEIRTAGNVTLTANNSGRFISQAAGNVILANTLSANAHSGITFNANNTITSFTANNTTANGIQYTQSAGSLLTVTGITQTGGNVTVTADDLNITGVINAGASTVTLRPNTLSQTINIGTATPGSTLNLSPIELSRVTAGTLEVGRPDGTGTLTVASPVANIDVNAATLKLLANDININADIGTTGARLGKNLELRAANNTTIAIGNIYLDDNRSLTVVADSDSLGGGNVNIGAAQVIVGIGAGNTTGNMTLQGNSAFIALGGSSLGTNVEVTGSGSQTISARETIQITNNSSGSASLLVRTAAGTQTIDACQDLGAGCTTSGVGNMAVQGGAGGANISVASGSGSQVIRLKGGLQVSTDAASNASGNVVVNANTGQTIGAQFIEVISRGASQAAINNNTGAQNASTQTITTRGQNAFGEGIRIEALGSGPSAGIFNLSSGLQSLAVNNADRLLVRGATGPAGISSNGSQNLLMAGTGLHSVEIDSKGGTAGIQKNGTAGAQSITVNGGGSISVGGGDASVGGRVAQIYNQGTGGQTISFGAGGSIALSGGTVGAGNVAKIQTENGNQTIAGATGISLTGGASGSNNNASISSGGSVTTSPGNQSISVGSGGLVLTGGGGAGTNNSASITQPAASRTQTIAVSGGGNITLAGGTVGNNHFAQILAASGDQTITGSPNITLTGGASGGADSAGNTAQIRALAGSQQIAAGNVTLIAGGAPGAIDSFVAIQAPTQNITVNGALLLTGNAAGSGVRTGARIGGIGGDTIALATPTNLTLTVHGDITVNGGTAGSATIGSNRVGGVTTDMTIVADGNVTLNGGPSAGRAPRIGSPDPLDGGTVAGGNIFLTAGGDIAMNGNSTGTAIRTLGNVTVHADNPGKTFTTDATSFVAADRLIASANSGMNLPGPNQVARANLTSGGGSINFVNTRPLTFDGGAAASSIATPAGTQTIAITTSGVTSDITLNGNLIGSDDNYTFTSGRDILIPGVTVISANGATLGGAGSLRFPSGSVLIHAPITSNMPVVIEGGTPNFNDTATLNAGVALSSGGIQGVGDITIAAGTFAWSGGAVRALAAVPIAGPSIRPPNGHLLFATAAGVTTNVTGAVTLDMRDWANNGIVSQTGSGRVTLGRSFAGGNFPTIGNLAGAQWNVSGTDATPITGIGTFFNAGAFNNTGATTHAVNVLFLNQGTVTIGSGKLALTDFPTNAGTINVAAAATLATGGASLMNTGVIGGTGTVDVGAGTLTNSGIVAPGNSPGQLTVSGNYTQTSAGTLQMELGGTNAGTEHDALNVTGLATLGGTLSVVPVNGYSPPQGQSYSFLTYGNVSGNFSSVTAGYAGAPGPNGYSAGVAVPPPPPPAEAAPPAEVVVAALSQTATLSNAGQTTIAEASTSKENAAPSDIKTTTQEVAEQKVKEAEKKDVVNLCK